MPENATTLPRPRPNPEADTYGRHATAHPDDLPRLPLGVQVVVQRNGGRRRTERQPLTSKQFVGHLVSGEYTR